MHPLSNRWLRQSVVITAAASVLLVSCAKTGQASCTSAAAINSNSDTTAPLQALETARSTFLPMFDSTAFRPPEQSLPTDPDFGQEKHLFAMGATAAYKIFYHRKSGIHKDVVIAVIDTGVRIDHEDLRANLWVNKNEIPNNGIDDDGNGYIDDVYGYNFASDIADPSPQESSLNSAWQWAHGTKVAGLAAATAFNGLGGAGVAANARIMALNDMGRGNSMNQNNTANAVRYAIDNGADIINLSLGGNDGLSAEFERQLRRAVAKGIVVFAAAGNEHSLIGSDYSAAGLAPQLRGLISVGNYQSASDRISTTSNYSTTYVKLGAPGTNSMKDLLFTTSAESPSSYSHFSGTSAATPVASGAAALAIGLIKSRGYKYTAADIEDLLLQSARKVVSLMNYFRDGNALDLEGLAKLVDARYPQRSGVSASTEDSSDSANGENVNPSDQCRG